MPFTRPHADTAASATSVGTAGTEYEHEGSADDPLLGHRAGNADAHAEADAEEEEDRKSYFFTGKMGLFPVFILSTLVGAGILVTRGRLPYSKGYFTSSEVFYGIAGLVLFLFALAFLATSMRWLVFKITFSFTKDAFIVTKRGVWRTSRLEFALPITSLHYLRTHFVEDRSWLALVVREGDIYYRIFSWRGRGNQRLRFLRLFNYLRARLDSWHSDNVSFNANASAIGNSVNGVTLNLNAAAVLRNQGNPEIATREEVRLISPFSMRLRALHGIAGAGAVDESEGPDSDFGDLSASVCWEDVPVVNFDSFMHHYDFGKTLADGLSSRTMELLMVNSMGRTPKAKAKGRG